MKGRLCREGLAQLSFETVGPVLPFREGVTILISKPAGRKCGSRNPKAVCTMGTDSELRIVPC